MWVGSVEISTQQKARGFARKRRRKFDTNPFSGTYSGAGYTLVDGIPRQRYVQFDVHSPTDIPVRQQIGEKCRHRRMGDDTLPS